jgi:hypothetical protein
LPAFGLDPNGSERKVPGGTRSARGHRRLREP